MKQILIHFLRVLAAAVAGAVVTIGLSTVITFLAQNPTLFGGTTIVLTALFHALDEEWLNDEPTVTADITGISSVPTTPIGPASQ